MASRIARAGLLAGPACFLLTLLLWRRDGMGVTAGLTFWMAFWWMTEAIPIAATSLLPMVVLPLGAGRPFTLARVAANYGNSMIYLFFGGFLIAISMEETGLHRRIALNLVSRVGTSPRRLVLGFMAATAFLSMWISNTATALMMFPIAYAVLMELEGDRRFGAALMLGIAYAASIGGVGTLIGTPPNIAYQGQFGRLFPRGPQVSFAQWLGIGVPFILLFLPLAWLVLCRGIRSAPGAGRKLIAQQVAALGKRRPGETRVAAVFAVTALLWIFRAPIKLGAFTIHGWSGLFPTSSIDDGVVAMTMGLSLFLLPRGDGGGAILDWKAVKTKMPWGILLLFGGGFALADAVRGSGLIAEIGSHFDFLAGAPPILLIAGAALVVTFLTEVTSNTATAQILIPLTAGIAVDSAHLDPRALMLPVTIAASCAFMLPVATPPNAIVYASDKVTMRDMVRYGVVLNFIGVALVVLICGVLGPAVFGYSLSGGVPAWAAP